jgi:CBS domain-containing protein
VCRVDWSEGYPRGPGLFLAITQLIGIIFGRRITPTGYADENNPLSIERIIMATAREIMTSDVTCVGEKESCLDAAHKMADLDVGSLPICGDDNRLKGMLTDRDIVVKVLARDLEPGAVTAAELAQGKPVTVGADDDAAEILRTMATHRVRRLPVIDGHTLVGIVAVADVARALPDRPVGDLIDAIST